MLGYSVTILPLISQLKHLYPNLLHIWYTDDSGLMGPFDEIKMCFNSLNQLGKNYGYYPEKSKCVMIVSDGEVENTVNYFKEEEFIVETGNRYLGGYVG